MVNGTRNRIKLELETRITKCNDSCKTETVNKTRKLLLGLETETET